MKYTHCKHGIPFEDGCAACEAEYQQAVADAAGDAGLYGSDADYVTDPATGLGMSTTSAAQRGLGYLVP